MIILQANKEFQISIYMQNKMLLINNKRNKKPFYQLQLYLNVLSSKMNPLPHFDFPHNFPAVSR